MTLRKVLIAFLLTVLCLWSQGGMAWAQRTVIDKEVGAIYSIPDGFPYSDFGAYVGAAPPGTLDPAALKVSYARFHVFQPSDDTGIGFPYTALRQYESQEVAAGRPPIFVTATYMGKIRPVLFSWSLGLLNGIPTTSPNVWQYAVNVQDDRFIKFWINKYIRPVVWQPQYDSPNVWFELDECAFDWDLYGVLDDTNHFVAGVPWNSLFPQNASEYLAGIQRFFTQLKQLAPDIMTMANVGSMGDPTQFPATFANIPAIMIEDIYSWHSSPTAYIRNKFYTQTAINVYWFGSQGRPAILRAWLPPNDAASVVTAFVVYSLLKGPNFFFAPALQGSSPNPYIAIPPSEWEGMNGALGKPVGAMQSQLGSGLAGGYQLFWRQFEGGLVYLNLTGSTETVQLPSGQQYFDSQGTPITQITIPDLTGYCVLFSNMRRADKPQIAVRSGSEVTSPFPLTLSSDNAEGAIRYTLDGSNPSQTSTLYTGPFTLSNTAMVSATTSLAGYLDSFVSTASYTVSSGPPQVQFATSADSWIDGNYYPLLVLSSVSSQPVAVSYTITGNGFLPITGSVSFLPYELYRYFPITVPSGLRATVTLSQPSNAVLGQVTAFQYMISSPPLSCDLNFDGTIDVIDVQLAINQALGITPCSNADLIGTGTCNVVDVQRIITAALGGSCHIGV